MRRLLAERDLAEAKGEAERAETSLERAGEHLDELAEARRARHGGVEAERDKRADAVGEARGLAQEIADDLSKLMPKPSETLTPADREAARGQAEKQARHRQADRRAWPRRRRGAWARCRAWRRPPAISKGAGARMQRGRRVA